MRTVVQFLNGPAPVTSYIYIYMCERERDCVYVCATGVCACDMTVCMCVQQECACDMTVYVCATGVCACDMTVCACTHGWVGGGGINPTFVLVARCKAKCSD